MLVDAGVVVVEVCIYAADVAISATAAAAAATVVVAVAVVVVVVPFFQAFNRDGGGGLTLVIDVCERECARLLSPPFVSGSLDFFIFLFFLLQNLKFAFARQASEQLLYY